MPGQASDFKIPKEAKLEYFQELMQAKRKENWDDYHEAVLKLKLASAEEVNFTPEGIEIKVSIPSIQSKNSPMPEVKKF